MTAYYNEIDPYAAQWLRNLIAAGHIAPGHVDERSIEDVRPYELAEFTQCHFFAGIGIWSLALRNAGWCDTRPVWTGSCPCQPFSAAGKGKQFADERHLWPALFHLASVCRPAEIIGEQVASSDGLAWLDLVQADMESAGYAFGAVDLSAAGFAEPEITGRMGGAHIRQRLYWGARRMENAELPAIKRQRRDGRENLRQQKTNGPSGASVACGPGNGNSPGMLRGRCSCGMGDAAGARRDGAFARTEGEAWNEARLRVPGSTGRILNTGGGRRIQRSGEGVSEGIRTACERSSGLCENSLIDWIPCRDGKWRPVESGTFPLAHEDPQRLGRLRAYGNAIVAATAKAFITAWMDCAP